MIDTFKHQGMRRKLVEDLQKKGIEDKKVIDALLKVPRHFFFDSSFLNFAYQDKAFPIGAGQTISQPFTVAFQTQLLQVKKGNKILEIGTGSGYQTAILCEVGAKVYSVERQKELFIKAKDDLKKLGYLPALLFGDGYKGLPVYAPFDGVLVTCGAPFLPEKLVEQVKVGGRIVIPIGDDGKQIMFRYIKNADGSLSEESFGDFAFVPMLEKVSK
jgi:protein-L-isoaspartate(D-aspartate) O-methyltransferase